MAKTTKKTAAPKTAKAAEPEVAASEPAQQGGQPSLRILGQYLKDLSFENPLAPQSLSMQLSQPDITVSVNVNARNLAATDFEVELQLDAKAQSQGKVVFESELVYCGIFRLENFPENLLHPAVLIECPRLLFPFARQIMAEATRNGGFPPLMLDPVDFAAMYQARMRREQGSA